MVRKSLISVMLVAVMVFAAGLAFAAHHSTNIDGLSGGMDVGGYDIYVNPGNLGDTLVAGYFNTRGVGNFFTIVNTADGSGVIARIRFREATESEEILDFNICLSEQDVFAGIIVDDGSQARLFQLESDTTLTSPALPDSGVAFKHAGNGGLATVSADETMEGYYEIIGLVAIDQAEMDEDDFVCPTDTRPWGLLSETDVPNVLTGSHFMNEDGTANLFGYRMLALANFADLGIPSAFLGSENITLDYNGARSAIDWAATKANFSSEYMIFNNNDPIIGDVTGESAYVVNFFTKKLNIEADTDKFGDAVNCPESDSQYMDPSDDLLGVTIGVDIFDENENQIEDPEQFSPTVTTEIRLCYEVNVIELGPSDILDSNVEIDLSTGAFGFGWIKVDLYNGVSDHSQDANDAPFVTNGLPAWVTWLQTVNGVLSHEQEVAYETDIEAIAQ